jgi:hypothetical protein
MVAPGFLNDHRPGRIGQDVAAEQPPDERLALGIVEPAERHLDVVLAKLLPREPHHAIERLGVVGAGSL